MTSPVLARVVWSVGQAAASPSCAARPALSDM